MIVPSFLAQGVGYVGLRDKDRHFQCEEIENLRYRARRFKTCADNKLYILQERLLNLEWERYFEL